VAFGSRPSSRQGGGRGGPGGNGRAAAAGGRGRRTGAPRRWDAEPSDGAEPSDDKSFDDGARPPEPEADPEQVARQICLAQLEHAPRTRAELAAVLARTGVPDEVAEQVLGRFGEVGLIDDAVFARLWVSSRHRGRGLAGRALSQELRRKGVDEELVREAVGELDPDTERATARALVDRRLPATRGLAADARLRRLAGMLARKGYGPGLAFAVVREALAAEGQDVELGFDALTALDE
jgi:regulatory protein